MPGRAIKPFFPLHPQLSLIQFSIGAQRPGSGSSQVLGNSCLSSLPEEPIANLLPNAGPEARVLFLDHVGFLPFGSPCDLWFQARHVLLDLRRQPLERAFLPTWLDLACVPGGLRCANQGSGSPAPGRCSPGLRLPGLLRRELQLLWCGAHGCDRGGAGTESYKSPNKGP